MILRISWIKEALSSAQGYPSGPCGAPPVYSVVKGNNLFETLAYNLVPLDNYLNAVSPSAVWRSSCFCPMFGTIAWADDLEQQNQVDTAAEAKQPAMADIPAEDIDVSESEEDVSEPAEDSQQKRTLLSEEEAQNPVPDTEAELVFGDENLADEDAFVLFISGDGFTSSEQYKFYEEAKKTADYIMETSPYDEFKDVIKIYAKGVISNESGARADNANTQDEADADTRDTFYGTSFWTEGMQRLLYLGDEGKAKLEEVKDKSG